MQSNLNSSKPKRYEEERYRVTQAAISDARCASSAVSFGSFPRMCLAPSSQPKTPERQPREMVAKSEAKGSAVEPFGRASVLAAIEELKRGRIIVVTDDEDRENEGDLIMAAEFATPETVGFIVRYTSGVICVSVPGQRLDELQLPPMYVNNEDPKGTAFTVSTDVKHGTTTGISAADRAATFRALADERTQPTDLCRPGHVFPLRPREGGVLERGGHTEAAMDFCKLAGLKPCGVLAEVVNDDGSMARVPQLVPLCKAHGLVLTSIADLQAYIKETR